MQPIRSFSVSILFLSVILSACGGPRPSMPGPDKTPAPSLTAPLPGATWLPTASPLSFSPSAPAVTPGFLALHAAQVRELARWGKGAITAGEYSPDGKRLGVVTTQGVYFYDAGSLDQLDFITGGSVWPAVAFTPDWSLLAMGSGSTVTLLRLPDKTEAAHFDTEQGKVTQVLFSPDGRLLVSLVRPPGEEVYNGILDLWDVADGKLLATWDAGEMPALVFTPDSQSLYGFSMMKGVRHWQIPSGSPLAAQNDLALDGLQFSPDGQWMVTTSITSDHPGILVQKMPDGTQERTLTWEHQPAGGRGLLRFSPDGSRLVAFSGDGFVQVWRVADGTLLNTFPAAPVGSSSFMAISPDGQTLALPDPDGIAFYNLTDGQLLSRLGDHPDVISTGVLSPQNDRVAALVGRDNSDTDSLVVWTLPEGKIAYTIPKVGGICLAWSPQGDRLAWAGWDDKIHILQASDGTLLQTLPGHSEQVQSVAWSPDGTRIASSSMRSVKVWQVQDGTLFNALSVSVDGWVDRLWFSPDGKRLAGRSADGSVQIWQMSDGKSIQEIPLSAPGIANVIEFAPDGSYLAVAQQARLWLYHSNEIKPFQTLPVLPANVLVMRIAPDSALLACGLTDGTVQLWQLPAGKLLGTLKSAAMGVATSMDFSVDGKSLLVTADDGSIRLWGVPVLKPVAGTQDPTEAPVATVVSEPFATSTKTLTPELIADQARFQNTETVTPISDSAGVFLSPEDMDSQTFMAFMPVVREYFYYRKKAILANSVEVLWARFPGLKQGVDINNGINAEEKTVTNTHFLNPFDGNISPESRERIKVKLSGDHAELLVHGGEMYLYRDQTGNFDETGGELKIILFVQQEGSQWMVYKTQDISGP